MKTYSTALSICVRPLHVRSIASAAKRFVQSFARECSPPSRDENSGNRGIGSDDFSEHPIRKREIVGEKWNIDLKRKQSALVSTPNSFRERNWYRAFCKRPIPTTRMSSDIQQRATDKTSLAECVVTQA